MNLYNNFIERLVEVNDESKTESEHRELEIAFYGWKAGVLAACSHYGICGPDLNGDYHYIELGIDRPMCCGLFLDWKHKEPEPKTEELSLLARSMHFDSDEALGGFLSAQQMRP